MSKILYMIITGKGSEAIKINGDVCTEEKWWNSLFGNEWSKKEYYLDNCILYIKRGPLNALNREVINNILKCLKEKYCKEDINNINIFVHWLNYYEIDELSNDYSDYSSIRCNNREIKIKWYGYTTFEGGKGAIEVVKEIIQLLRDENINNVCSKLDELTSEAEKKTEQERIKKHLTLLLHRIAHLFLPLDIDLMGILEVLKSDFRIPIEGKNQEEWARKYYQEAFNGKNPKQRFCELLKKASKKVIESNLDEKLKFKIDNCLNDSRVQDKLPESFENLKCWAKNNKNPFHDWFCAIVNCLEDIKTKLSTK